VKKVLIYGISGATWTVIDPLLQAGRLPTFARLIEGGVRAVASSVRAEGDKHFRPQIAWPTVSTGVLPARHGVTRFFHRYDDVVVPSIWDYFQSAGARVGLFGWPIVWPPRQVNGFMIPTYDGRDASTWPPELSYIRTLDRRQEAARGGKDVLSKVPVGESLRMAGKLLKGGVSAGTFARLASAAADSKLRAPAELRPLLLRRARLQISVDMFRKLCDQYQPQFSAFATFLVDYAAHRFWLFHEPERFADAPKQIPPRLRDALIDSYIAVDRALGRILSFVDNDTVIAVVSEHGMAIEPVSAEIGPWHYVMRPNKLKEFVGLPESMPANPVARWIALRPGEDRLNETADTFRKVTIEPTGQPLFQVYIHRDEVIVKLALTRAQNGHLNDLNELSIRFGQRVAPFTQIAQRFGRRRSAMHAEDAVMILHGPGIRCGMTLDRCGIADITPTLLHAAGLAVPAGLDGQVLPVF